MSQSRFLTTLIQFFASFVEILIGFRIILKLFGASTSAPFVNWIYQTSNPLISPFAGMFPSPQIDGLFQLDFSSIFALIAYTLIFYLIIEAISIIEHGSAKLKAKS